MKFLRISLLGLLALIALAVIVITALLYASRPATSGTLLARGLEQAVHIRFDSLQRPFVEARELHDALYAEGFLHASHRLWQMETLRRAGRGRLSELLGSDALATDRELWLFGVPRLAQQLRDNASPELEEQVEAYVAGVNLALGQYRVPPPEFLLLQHRPEAWTTADVYAVGAMTAFQSAGNARTELLRLALLDTLGARRFSVFIDDNSERDDYPFVLGITAGEVAAPAARAARYKTSAEASRQALTVLDRLAATDSAQEPLMPRLGFGSNGWVVAPGKSRSGKALYAFDSHDALGLPNLFYEVHLFFGEGRQIRGWSAPGLPGVINGFNERIAWGFTNIGDTQDLFLEKNCDTPTAGYMEGELCRAAIVETVSIPVRGRAEPERIEIRFSHHGPLLSEAPPIAVSWTAHHIGGRSLDALLELNLARDPASIRQALDGWAAPSLNATWADVDGNIGFRTAGLLPVRGAGQGLFPLRGDRPEYSWQGFVAPERMPRKMNPDSGYLAAANGRVNPATVYPLVSADNVSPYRIQRLQDVLGRDRRFTVDDMRALQMDWVDGQAQQLLPALLTSIEGQTLSAGAEQALELLTGWQSRPLSAPDSAAALIFQAWYLEIGRAVFEPSLGPDLFQQLLKQGYLYNQALDILILSERHSEAWPEMQPAFRSLILAGALETTIADLTAILRSEPEAWRLDALQRVVLEHELGEAVPELASLFSEEPRRWGGSSATVGRAGYSYQKPFRVNTGATVRAVAEMKGTPAMAAVIPGGQSGHPLSTHYSDQYSGWLEGRLFPIAARPGDVGAATLHLVPASPVPDE